MPRQALGTRLRESMSAATDGMQEIVREFLAESAEGLDQLERHLVELERDPNWRQRLAEIFRAVHTLKGSSGMLGYSKLESVAHAGESLLGSLRDGKLVLSPELISRLLSMVDGLRGLLRAVERTGSEGTGDYANVVRSLEELLQSTAGPATSAEDVHDVPADGLGSEKPVPGGTIRVDVGLLDRLMDLAGELVLARNQVLGCVTAQDHGANVHAAQRLKRVTSDLQDAVMKARLQPIGSVWKRFPRLARDLALGCGKQVTVEMHGSETELDRGILEAIRDPLTHILRNAVDHGIEAPEQRIRAGKTSAGCLRLRASHQEGRVHIEISDDGAGIDLEGVQRRALEKGLTTPEQAAKMGERELANLVFLPGFSTAERVTNVSGRGIGLDVVRANIEKIGGVVDLQSVTGKGTALRFRIPLTLAIVPALIVSSAGQQFAIPQADLVEVARLPGASSIENVCGTPVYRLRERLLPLCFLDRELHLESSGVDDLQVVVVEAGGGKFGLVVDAVHDTEEIVVKPLGAQLSGIACFAGAAVLGDGQVVLILDVIGLARMAKVVVGPQVRPPDNAVATNNAGDGPIPRWLVFRGAAGSRFALPLAALVRLEEILADRIEHSAGREVVQYGGEILPLLRVSTLFHEAEPERELLPVAVIHESGSSAGLVMDRIEDIVEEMVELRCDGRSDLLEGSAVIQQRVADVLNLKNVLARAERPSNSGIANRGE
jgi:two-component system, chemotaxis family, sensor kinase CheA